MKEGLDDAMTAKFLTPHFSVAIHNSYTIFPFRLLCLKRTGDGIRQVAVKVKVMNVVSVFVWVEWGSRFFKDRLFFLDFQQHSWIHDNFAVFE